MMNIYHHIAELLHWRVAFGVAFLVILVCGAVYTLYKTYKRVLEHNKMAAKLREAAAENIRTQALTKMLLEKSQTQTWELVDGKFILTGYDDSGENEIDMESFRERFISSPFYRHKLHDFFNNEKPGSYMVQVYGALKDKQPHWYEVRMVITIANNRLVRKGTTVMIDQLKKREAMELDTNRMLANAKEKEDFISCMSHEIRTPLNAIVGISELLASKRDELTEDEISYFETEINKNNVQLMKMIEDMLTVTLIDNSSITVQYENLTYKDCVSDIRDVKEDIGLALFGVNVISQEVDDDVAIRADKNLLRRIMINLIDNAAKFSPYGSNVYVTRTVTDKEVILSVRDEGIGIDEQYHNLIFTRFYKVDYFSQGAGLGLALCKELAECMGAKMALQSEIGKGSVFSVIFKKV